MKTYLVQLTPSDPAQDTWALSFSLPYIATQYARAGDGLWYVRTWLTSEQIRRRLAILVAEGDELAIRQAGRDFALIGAAQIDWLPGRLEDEEDVELAPLPGPKAMWEAFQGLIEDIAQPIAGALKGSSSRSLKAA